MDGAESCRPETRVWATLGLVLIVGIWAGHYFDFSGGSEQKVKSLNDVTKGLPIDPKAKTPFFEQYHPSWNVADYAVPADQAGLTASGVSIENKRGNCIGACIWKRANYDGSWYEQHIFDGTPGEYKLNFSNDLSWNTNGPGNFYLSPENSQRARLDSHLGLGHRAMGEFETIGFDTFLGAMYEFDQTEPMRHRIAVFSDVWIEEHGWIVSAHVPQAVTNGGCDWYEPLRGGTPDGAIEYDRVIMLAAFWGDRHWHFPGELLMAFAYITQEQVDRSVIHVTKRTPYVLEWLDLIGIKEDKVVEGKVVARHLLVPEAGRCGTPARNQIDWLQRGLHKLTGAKMRRRVVLTKRISRGPANHDDIEKAVKTWAKEKDFEFILRTDDALGTIKDQVELVQKAAIMVTPHGANEVFDIGAHRGACKIEMLDVRNHNLCYARQSFWAGQQYSGVSCPLESPIPSKNALCISQIVERLETCYIPEGLDGGWQDTIDK